MIIKRGIKTIHYNQIKAIAEIEIDQYTIFVFPGTLSKNDFIVKYSKQGTRIRTPKHIHWVTDILMKMQGNPKLCKEFLKEMQEYWIKCKPLNNNSFESIKNLISENKNTEFDLLNQFGEYSMEFIFVLMKLLPVQEKTNRPDAYMFGDIIDELLKDEIDIFKIVSTAGFGGRR